MKGLELKHNDQVVTASIEDGVTSIFLSKENDFSLLNFCGLDNKTEQYVTWFESNVNKITIKVIDVDKATKIIKSKLCRKNTLDDKLVEYEGIKKYLEQEGLIKKG